MCVVNSSFPSLHDFCHCVLHHFFEEWLQGTNLDHRSGFVTTICRRSGFLGARPTTLRRALRELVQACLSSCRHGLQAKNPKVTPTSMYEKVRNANILFVKKKRHTDSDTEHQGARTGRINSSTTSRIQLRGPFSFWRFQSDLGPARC